MTTHLISPESSTEDKVRLLIDRQELHQILMDIRGFDQDDFERYKNAFTENVRMDVAEKNEFWEGKISDFSDMIKPMFDALDGKQHFFIPYEFDIRGDEATVKAYVRGFERRDDAIGSPEHRISAEYILEAERTHDGWKFNQMVKKVFWHDGNMAVLSEE